MSRDARSRLTLGIGIPLAAFLFLGLLIVAFSRILLVVPDTLAPWIALLFAVNILAGCALAATIPGTRGFTFLIAVVVGTIALGGVAALALEEQPVHSLVEETEHAGPPEEGAPPAEESPPPTEESPPAEAPGGGGGGQGAVSLVASNLAFDTDQVSLPADEASVISFDNQDAGVPHNVAIYDGGAAIFQGEIITGPATIDYEVPATPPGEYEFRCDVHPTTMIGTVTVG
ncbi:MAG: cupredoxin domain-containing protein [Actinomycetota bacterium]